MCWCRSRERRRRAQPGYRPASSVSRRSWPTCSGLPSSPNAASDNRSWRPIVIASSCCIAGAARWPSRTSLLEDRPGSNRRFVPSRTSRPDRGIAFRAMVGRQARPPASSSSDIMPAAQPAIDVHHGHDAFYDVEPRPGAVPGDGSSVQQPAGQSPDVAQLRGPVVHLLHAHVGCRVSRRTGRRRESCPRTPGARRRSCRGRGTRPRAW